jgi:hypothetical protein
LVAGASPDQMSLLQYLTYTREALPHALLPSVAKMPPCGGADGRVRQRMHEHVHSGHVCGPRAARVPARSPSPTAWRRSSSCLERGRAGSVSATAQARRTAKGVHDAPIIMCRVAVRAAGVVPAEHGALQVHQPQVGCGARERQATHSRAHGSPVRVAFASARKPKALSLLLHTRTGERTRGASAGGVVVATWTAVVADRQRVSFRQPGQRERRRAGCADWRGANRRPALAAGVEAARGREASGAGGVRVGRSRKAQARDVHVRVHAWRAWRVCAAALPIGCSAPDGS